MKIMTFKKCFEFVLVVINLLTLDSCCTKEYCLGADDMNRVHFYNILNENLDTIVVKKFAKRTDFKTLLSSTITVTDNFSNGTEFEPIRLNEKLTVDFDYKVELPGSGQVFTISDFVTKRESCNTGFMCNDHFNALKSYQVNGNPGVGPILALGK